MNLTIRFLCFWGVWVIFIGVVALSFLPYNPIQLGLNTKFVMFNLAPQGWGFFTRDPREERLIVYNASGDEIDIKITSVSNLFGLKRRNRAITNEIAHILSKAKASNLTSCNGSISNCIKNLKVNQIDTIDNLVSKPFLCGKYYIKIQKPIPWAWSNSRKNIIIPYEMINVVVTCNR